MEEFIIRIIDKETKMWKRDDFHMNPESEIGVVKQIPQGMYSVEGVCPLWDGEKWVQNVEPPTTEPEPQEPSESERLEALEMLMVDILGGGF